MRVRPAGSPTDAVEQLQKVQLPMVVRPAKNSPTPATNSPRMRSAPMVIRPAARNRPTPAFYRTKGKVTDARRAGGQLDDASAVQPANARDSIAVNPHGTAMEVMVVSP